MLSALSIIISSVLCIYPINGMTHFNQCGAMFVNEASGYNQIVMLSSSLCTIVEFNISISASLILIYIHYI